MSCAVIEVRVQPKASSSRMTVVDGRIKVYVTAAPEKGRANKAVIEVLARELGVPRRTISLKSGERSRTKLIEVKVLDPSEIERRLALSQLEHNKLG